MRTIKGIKRTAKLKLEQAAKDTGISTNKLVNGLLANVPDKAEPDDGNVAEPDTLIVRIKKDVIKRRLNAQSKRLGVPVNTLIKIYIDIYG